MDILQRQSLNCMGFVQKQWSRCHGCSSEAVFKLRGHSTETVLRIPWTFCKNCLQATMDMVQRAQSKGAASWRCSLACIKRQRLHRELWFAKCKLGLHSFTPPHKTSQPVGITVFHCSFLFIWRCNTRKQASRRDCLRASQIRFTISERSRLLLYLSH